MKWIKVKAEGIGLRDRIRLSNEPYMEATVIEIDGDWRTLFRPYITTSTFSYGNEKVIPYIGIEIFKIHKDSEVEVYEA